MKTIYQLILCAALFLAIPGTIHAGAPASPFGVNATLEKLQGSNVVRFSFTVPAGTALNAGRLEFETTDGRALAPSSLPTPVLHQDANTGTEKKVFAGNFSAEIPLQTPLPETLVVKLQGCSNTACYFPERRLFQVTASGIAAVSPSAGPANSQVVASITTAGTWLKSADHFQVVSRETGYVSKGKLLSFLTQSKTGQAGAGDGSDRFQHLGLMTSLFLIVIGGIGLNFTPCVLPMIPINLAIIGAGARAASRKNGFVLGAVYGAGMALVYGTLGLVVVLTGAKFGTLNSSIWFNVAIAVIFVVMALAMFDRLNIDFSRFSSGSGATGPGHKSKFILAFTMGIVAALMAGACVAPVVISVLLLSAHLYTQGLVIGLLLPFLLGLGMALPWPFAGAGLTFLPKPGVWMKWVKYSFGALILLFASYYGQIAVKLFLVRRSQVVFARQMSGAGSTAANSSQNQTLTAALEQARAEGRPVFIDFKASWCKNCEAMDAVVFPSADVQQQLKDFVVVRYDAEQPNESPAKEVLDRFGVMGLPTYVVLRPEK